ncbi:protein of unknown function [Aminobacter niigataensis]|nr:protein of unknown function [Aminobacter niigataensis]
MRPDAKVFDNHAQLSSVAIGEFQSAMPVFSGLKNASGFPCGTAFVFARAALRLRLRKRQAGEMPEQDTNREDFNVS